MVNYTWLGTLSTSANNSGNWSPVNIPSSGDVVIFDGSATANCVWDIPTGAGLTVDEIIVESTFAPNTLEISVAPNIKGLYLDGTIVTGAGANLITFEHGASPNYFGSYKTYNERFILFGDNAVSTGLTFTMTGSATPVTKFDDGNYPTVTISAGAFAPDYVAPTGTSGKATFDSLTLSGTATFAPDGDFVDNDRLKVFSFKDFTCQIDVLNYGQSTVEYYATVGAFVLPASGTQGLGLNDGFKAYYRKIVLKTTQAGWRVVMADNTFISLEEFEIDDGVVFRGAFDLDSQGSEIRTMSPPKIRGTWSFSQVGQGVYRSPRWASGTQNHKVIQIDTSMQTDVLYAGEMRWDENENTVAVGAINGINAHIGQTFQWSVKNQTGGTLNAGTVVMAVGSIGASGKILIDAMDASGTGDAKLLVGVLQEDVATGGDSVALALGRIKGIDLTALKPVSETWANGDVLYCDQANAGGLTNVAPSSGIILPIGFIIHYDANGSLAVRALPIDEGATGGGGGTPAGSNTQVQFNNSGAFGASSDLTWDDSAKELYVNGKLTVTGLIDPTGLELNPQVSNPSNANTLWLDSGASNRLKQGSTKVIQAGDPVSDLADDGTYATFAQGATADAALPTTGGTMTGEIEGTTITLNAVPADPQTDNKVRLGESGATSNMLRIQTNDGYLDIGANNGSYVHFLTDRNTFYMSKPLVIAGGYFLAYSGDMKLGTGVNSTSATTAITIANGSTDITVAGQTESTAFVKTGGTSNEFLKADGSVSTLPLNQYERYYFDTLSATIPASTTTQLTFGSPGSAVLVPKYSVASDFSIPPTNDRILINTAGLYQINFTAFLAGISGGTTIDWRMTLSTSSSLYGDVLSFRNRTVYVDRYTNSGVATVFLNALDEVFISVRCDGRSYQIGGLVATADPLRPEMRTFVDIRRLE